MVATEPNSISQTPRGLPARTLPIRNDTGYQFAVLIDWNSTKQYADKDCGPIPFRSMPTYAQMLVSFCKSAILPSSGGSYKVLFLAMSFDNS